MEETDLNLLKNTRKHVMITGKWMNIFSVLAGFVAVIMVIGGIAMLYVSNMLDGNSPYHMDNIMGIGGVAMIILSGTLLPAILRMRVVVRIANNIKVNNDLSPIVEFMRQTQRLWHYTTILLIVLCCVGVIVAGIAGLLYLSIRSYV